MISILSIYYIFNFAMGKRNIDDDSDQEMDIEPQVASAPKHKKIKKTT